MVMDSKGGMRVDGEADEAASISIIRRETVLSKFPIHNLAKQGQVNIQIVKRGDNKEVTLKWEVSSNARFGPPRALAYKLDTLYINKLIDEAGRPLPRFLCLGSLRDIAKELGLGGDTNKLKNAFKQNASAFISAKIAYKGADGGERTLEADFNRYSVVFTGEKLPSGRRANAVYIFFTDPFWEVLNNAPIRPLNYEYLRTLKPSAQRCYEIISYWIYSAIKYGNEYAKLAYSDYCAFSAQPRYYDYEQVKKQMYKVHRPHIASGYLAKVKFEENTDAEGKADWTMYYTPGPRARAEYGVFKGAAGSREPAGAVAASGESKGVNEDLVRALVARGVLEKVARAKLAGLPNDIFVADQIEYVDHIIESAGPGAFRNPPGFYVHMIFENNVFVPLWFETSRRRRLKEEDEGARRAAGREEEERLEAYKDYVRRAVEQQMAAMTEDSRRRLLERKRRELVKSNAYMRDWDESSLADVVHSAALNELQERMTFASFEEFCAGDVPAPRLIEDADESDAEESAEGGAASFVPLSRDEIAQILREGSKKK